MGMPSYGGKYGGGGNYSGGQRYNMGSVGSHVGAGSNAPGFSSPADVNFSTAKGGAMSSPSGQKYTIGNTLNVNSFYGGQKVSMGGRSFNPGNIKYSGSDWQKQALSKYMAGVSSEKDEGTNQIMFKNPVAGAAASTRLTMAYVTGKKVKNIQEYVAYYTPGNVAGHSAHIAKLMGVSPTANLNWRDPNVMYRFERAKQIAEVGKATYEAMGGDRMAMRGVMHAFKNDGVSSGFVNEIPKSVTAFFETQPAGAKQPENAKQPAGANQPENAKATRGLRPAITGTRVFKANAPTKNMSGADITKKALDLSRISGFVAHDSSGHKHGRDPEFQAYRRFKREGMSDQDAYYKAYKGIRDNRTRRAYHQQFERGTVHYNPLTTQRGHAASLNSSMLGMAHLGFEGVKLDKQTVATGAAGMMKMYHEVKKEKPDMTFDAFIGMWKTHPQLGTAGTRNANPKQHNEGAWVTQVEQYFKTPEGQALQKLPYDRLMNITQEQLYSGKYDATASSSRPTASQPDASRIQPQSQQRPQSGARSEQTQEKLTPVETGPGQEKFGYRGRGSPKGVDPRLMELFKKTAEDFPLRVRFMSGKLGRSSGAHSRGRAGDITIYDDAGNALPNYQNSRTFRIYEMFAQKMRENAKALYPELADNSWKNGELDWGGLFGGAGNNPNKMKYGSADTMDYRINYGDMTRAGSIEGGLNRRYKGSYDKKDIFGGSKAYSPGVLKEDLERLKGFRLNEEQIKDVREYGFFDVARASGRLPVRKYQESTMAGRETPSQQASVTSNISRQVTAQGTGPGTLAGVLKRGAQIGGVGPIRHKTFRGLCGKGSRGIVGALLNESYFRKGIGAGGSASAGSLSFNNNYLQSSGFYQDRQMVDKSKFTKEFMESLPIGTVVSSAAEKGRGHGHVQVKLANGKWASDALQNGVLLSGKYRKDGYAIHIPNAKGFEKLNPSIVGQHQPTLDAMQNIGVKVKPPTQQEQRTYQQEQQGPGMAGRETPLQFHTRLYGNIAEVSKTSGFSQNQLAAILGVPSTQKFEQYRARQAEEKRKQQLGRKALGQFTQAEINAARQEVPGPMGTRRQETDQEVRQRLTKTAINEVAVLKQEDQTKTGFGAMDEIIRRSAPDFDIMDRNIRSAQLQSEQRAAMVPGVSDAALAQRMSFARNAFPGENAQIVAQRQLLEKQRQAIFGMDKTMIQSQIQSQQAQMMNQKFGDFAISSGTQMANRVASEEAAMLEASRVHPLANLDGGQFKKYGDIGEAESSLPSTPQLPQAPVNEFADFKKASERTASNIGDIGDAVQEAEKAPQNTELMTGGLNDANVAQKASDAANEVKEKQAKGSTATSKSQKSSSGSGTGGSRGGSGGTNHPESEPSSPGSGGYGSYGRCFV